MAPWAKLQAMLQDIPHFWVLVLGVLFLVPGLLFWAFSFLAFLVPSVLSSFLEWSAAMRPTVAYTGCRAKCFKSISGRGIGSVYTGRYFDDIFFKRAKREAGSRGLNYAFYISRTGNWKYRKIIYKKVLSFNKNIKKSGLLIRGIKGRDSSYFNYCFYF